MGLSEIINLSTPAISMVFAIFLKVTSIKQLTSFKKYWWLVFLLGLISLILKMKDSF